MFNSPAFKKPDHCATWEEAVQHLRRWTENPWRVFRGQSDSEWGVETTMQRLCTEDTYRLDQAPEYEKLLLQAFKRSAHLFGAVIPEKADDLSWLALMQHYGAPTRLLDWTRSPYVAAFFAFNAKLPTHDPDRCVAIYSVDSRTIDRRAREILRALPQLKGRQTNEEWDLADSELFERGFLSNAGRFIAPVRPFHYSDRIHIQQGLFMCVGDVQVSFQENLETMSGRHSELISVEGITIPASVQQTALPELLRMNIAPGSLFPGLAGFASDLTMRLRLRGQCPLLEELMSIGPASEILGC